MLEKAQGRQKKRWSKTKKIVVFSIIAVVAILGAIAGKFIYDVNNPQNLFAMEEMPLPETPQQSATPPVQGASGVTTPTPAPTPDPEELLRAQADAQFMKKTVNILMLGRDESTERANWGSFRTDTMILLSVNFEENKVDMISIPRDSYVRIYNQAERAKINSAFAAGGGVNKKGYEYATKTVSQLMGDVPINYYVGFNMNVVKEVVNIIGGVDYNVDIEVTMNGRKLYPGQQHLDGQQVLDYCRQRKGSSDIARAGRQQQMLKAIFAQLVSTKQLGNIPQIYSTVSNNLDTNLNLTQISALALFAFKLDVESINAHIVPGDFLNMNSVSYWGVNMYSLRTLVKNVFGRTLNVNPEDDVAYIKKEIEEMRKQLEGTINAAQKDINAAKQLLVDYAASIAPQDAHNLNSAIAQAEEAIIDGAEEYIVSTHQTLKEVYGAILARLGLGVGTIPQVGGGAPSEQGPFTDPAVPPSAFIPPSLPELGTP